MKGHRIILNDFLNLIKRENITSILDAGSGRTSLSIITSSFPDTSIDAVIYPGDKEVDCNYDVSRTFVFGS